MNISPNSVLRKGYQSLCTNKESHLESSFQFFFVDFRSFLLEGIRVSSLGSLSFQAHLRLVWELLPTVVVSCFDRLAKKGVDWFHENISKRLHTHSLFSILSNLPMDSHHSHLRSCPGLRVGVQLFPCLIVPFFFLALNVFSSMMRTNLGLPHPLALGLSHCIYGQPLNPARIHLFHCAHGEERMASHGAM